MFKKLVSDIPFNPSLIEHIPEYRASLRKERKLRFIGLFLLSLALIVQILISVFPAQSSITSSPNDLVTGGLTTQSDAVRDCNNNINNYRSILSRFSITCSDLVLAAPTTITAGSYQNQLYSINRINYGGPNEKLISISNQSYWARPLSQGNALSTTKLQTLSGISNLGVRYFIINNSGNLAFIGQPINNSTCNLSSSLNCPKTYITARSGETSNSDGTTVKSGDTIIYTLVASNLSQHTIKNYSVGTNFGSALSYSIITNLYGGTIRNNSYIYWPATSLKPGQTIAKNISFRVKSPIPKSALSSSDANYNNLKMTTYYGNAVVIKLPWSFNKFVELKINNGFPSQGVIFSMSVSLLLIIIVSFFLYRNTLLLKELNNVKDDYLMGDGS